ncbi:hypothetical protein ACJIZ3_017175 [Penstemon smallii]|uniref:Cytochrome b5 heme-binding domain-containing protein n=1 Tax=Penstemon smallii TaxID=265156 RepID=A0ABD3SVX0_9LAMI
MHVIYFRFELQVYNVTRYLSDHPGGDEVLLAAAGKDASEEFEDVGHGSAARLMLDEFYIGEVDVFIKANTEVVITPTLAAIDKKKKSLDPINKFLYFIVLAFFIITLGVGFHFFNLSS